MNTGDGAGYYDMKLELTDKEINLVKYILGETVLGIDYYEDSEYYSTPLPLYFTKDELETIKDILTELHKDNDLDVADFVDRIIKINMQKNMVP